MTGGLDINGSENEQLGSSQAQIEPEKPDADKKSVIKSFVDLVTNKVDENVLRAPIGKEREVLSGPIINPGLYFGLAVGVIQFTFLRKAPIYMVRRLQQQQGLPPTFQESPIMRTVSLVFDATLSLATACAVWAFAVDEKKVYQAAASIPLIEGRSDISDALCDETIAQHKNIPASFWDYHARSDDSIASLLQFIENCQKRRAHENCIRLEQGLSKDVPVSIPKGGVSITPIDDFGWDDQNDFSTDGEANFPEGFEDYAIKKQEN